MGVTSPRGLVDTSVHIAGEAGRPIDVERMPDSTYTSVVTIGELRAGVVSVGDAPTRRRRQAILDSAFGSVVLDVDSDVAEAWADVRAHVVGAGRRVTVDDLWIAATAVHHIPVVTQDDDFDVVRAVRGLEVVRA